MSIVAYYSMVAIAIVGMYGAYRWGREVGYDEGANDMRHQMPQFYKKSD